MAKKSAEAESNDTHDGSRKASIEERQRRRDEATTVDGSEVPSSANAGGEQET